MKLEERVAKITSDYAVMFAERGDATPVDPLEFHLFHLARYWSRLVGFCRQTPDGVGACLNGDLGACIQVGTKHVGQLIAAESKIAEEWETYTKQVHDLFHEQRPSLESVEEASATFDRCLAGIKYNPWANKILR